jgi:hypothetical protein
MCGTIKIPPCLKALGFFERVGVSVVSAKDAKR